MDKPTRTVQNGRNWIITLRQAVSGSLLGDTCGFGGRNKWDENLAVESGQQNFNGSV
jgi:hypothetical protein